MSTNNKIHIKNVCIGEKIQTFDKLINNIIFINFNKINLPIIILKLHKFKCNYTYVNMYVYILFII